MPRRPFRALILVGGLLAALVGLPATPAYAVPTAAADRYEVYTDADYLVSPLENDSGSVLFPGPLSLCGLVNPSPQKLYIEQVGDQVMVEVSPEATGTVRFTYEVCERSSRATGTVTLVLTTLDDVTGAKKRSPRGKITFTNTNTVDVSVRWGSATSGNADGMRTIGAGRTIVVATERRTVYFVAFYLDGDVLVPAGDGTIRDIQQPTR